MPHIHVVDGQAEGVFQGLRTLTHVMKQRSVHSVYCADLKYHSQSCFCMKIIPEPTDFLTHAQ